MPNAIAFTLAYAGSNIAAAAGASVAAQAAISAALASSLATSLVLTAGSVALSYALAPRPTLVPPSDGQQTVKDALAARTKSYGTVRTAGTRVFFEAKSRDLYEVDAMNHGKISEVIAVHVDENTVSIDSGTKQITSRPYSSQPSYIYANLGEDTETQYAALNTTFGLANMRGDGLFSILSILRCPTNADAFSETFPTGRPLIRATFNASLVWDPRDTDQDREDNSTWGFTDNAVVCWLSYLLDPDGYGLSYDRIEPNLAQWIEAMDICDEEVDLAAGGTSARYRIALTCRLTDDPRDVVKRFESACDGRMWQKRDGSIGVSVGRFVEPTITLTDDHILGYSDLTRGQDALTRIEGLRASFMSPAHDYREHEAEPWPNAETVLAFDEDRVATLDLNCVPADAQARRLMKRDYARRTAEWSGTILTNLAGLRALDERYIRVQISELGLDTTFEVQSFAFDPSSMTCSISILSVDSSIDEWSTSEESADEGDTEFELAGNDIFSKTGTALDPISEAGGGEGDGALVFAVAASLAATPTDWELVSSASGGGMAMGVYHKVLDGTEISTTFLGGAGVMICAIMEGVGSPAFDGKAASVSASAIGSQNVTAKNPPNQAIFTFGAANAVLADGTFVTMTEPTVDTFPADEVSEFLAGAVFSAVVKMILYGTAENVRDVRSTFSDDLGQNGLITFRMRPGI